MHFRVIASPILSMIGSTAVGAKGRSGARIFSGYFTRDGAYRVTVIHLFPPSSEIVPVRAISCVPASTSLWIFAAIGPGARKYFRCLPNLSWIRRASSTSRPRSG